MSKRAEQQPPTPPLADADVSLRILASTDLHACLTSWDYFAHKIAPNRGLSRVASLIAQARSGADNVLLFDNGDFLSGSGLGDHMAVQYPAPVPHPMIVAMNQLGYDAVNLGNHEFSHGLGFLRHSLQDAAFPLICSNFQINDLPQVQRALMLRKTVLDGQGAAHSLTIGVIGLLPSQTMMWEAANLQGNAQASPMLQTARNMADDLRRQGADIIIALAHTGLPSDPHEGISEENMANDIASLPEIDAVIAGHSHKVHPEKAGQGSIVLPGFFGSHLGVLDLTLHKAGTQWQVLRSMAEARPVAQRDAATGAVQALVPEDTAVMRCADLAHAQILDIHDEVIGKAPLRLHSYFATVASSPALAIVAAAQADALAAQLSGGPCADLPILSAVAPFKAGGRSGPEYYTDFASGPMRQRHAADLYLHPNTLVGFRITGAELALWLERSVSLFAQIAPSAKDADLINPDFPSFNFDVVFGVTYQVDLTKAAQFDARGVQVNPNARRIVNLRYKGQPVRDDQRFVLASNSYRRDTHIGFFGASEANVVCAADTRIQAILRAYIMAQKPFPVHQPAHWGFLPLDGATVQLRTSPKASEVLGDIAHLRPHPLGLDATGFQRFRLHL